MTGVTDAQRSESEEPHDVLAAEEFEIGTRDERFPPDPSGIGEAHDVLAAEEFPLPSADAQHVDGQTDPRSWLPLLSVALLCAAAAWVLVRKR